MTRLYNGRRVGLTGAQLIPDIPGVGIGGIIGGVPIIELPEKDLRCRQYVSILFKLSVSCLDGV